MVPVPDVATRALGSQLRSLVSTGAEGSTPGQQPLSICHSGWPGPGFTLSSVLGHKPSLSQCPDRSPPVPSPPSTPRRPGHLSVPEAPCWAGLAHVWGLSTKATVSPRASPRVLLTSLLVPSTANCPLHTSACLLLHPTPSPGKSSFPRAGPASPRLGRGSSRSVPAEDSAPGGARASSGAPAPLPHSPPASPREAQPSNPAGLGSGLWSWPGPGEGGNQV